MLQYDKTGPPHLSAATSSRPTAGPQQDAGAFSSSPSSSSSSSSSSLSSSSPSQSSSVSSSSASDRHHLHHHQQQQQPTSAACAACRQVITDRYLLRAVDETWHEDCLRCSVCDCCLGRIGATLFTKDDLLLCRHDYLRLYGVSGVCSGCAKLIPAFEMVMKAGDNVYHLDCFHCAECKNRFCVGDRYYLSDGQQTILCEYDYHLHHRQTLLHHHLHNHQQQQQIASWLSSSSSSSATAAGHSLTSGVNGQSDAGDLALLPPSAPPSVDDGAHYRRTMSQEGKGGGPSSSSRRSSIDSPDALPDDASSGYGSPSPDIPTTNIHHHQHHHGPPL